MCLRCSNKINTNKNGTGKCLCIAMIVLDILSFILYIVGGVAILINMNKEDDYEYRGYSLDKEKEYSNRIRIAIGVSFTITEIVLIFHCMCSIMLYKIINAKTNKSYSNYLNEKGNESNTNGNIYNMPQTEVNINQLTFIGYDKDGHPIYQGNTQYQNQINSTQNITNTPIMVGNNNGKIFSPGE